MKKYKKIILSFSAIAIFSLYIPKQFNYNAKASGQISESTFRNTSFTDFVPQIQSINKPKLKMSRLTNQNQYTDSKGNIFYYSNSGNNEITITGASVSTSDVTIPSTINGISVRYIGYGAFYQNNLESIIIPKTIKSINGYAFSFCPNLSKVTFNNSFYSELEYINEAAFVDCKKLTSISIPSKVKEIKFAAFQGCSALKSVTLASSIHELDIIGAQAFYGCTSITFITFPKLTRIDNYAFYGCSSLGSIGWLTSDKRLTIGQGAFSKTNLQQLYLPSSLKVIEAYAFGDNPNLSKLSLNSNSIESIYRGAFASCPKLSLEVPDGLTSDKIIDTGYNAGYVKQCIGTQTMVSLYLNSPNCSWDEINKNLYANASQSAYFEIKNQAKAKYNIETSWLGLSDNVNISDSDMNKIKNGEGHEIFTSIMDDYIWMGTNNTIFTFYINDTKLSYTLTDGDNKEYCVIFRDDSRKKSVIMHEMLHLYGAYDLYEPRFSSLTNRKYPNDIMAYTNDNNIDIGAFTANRIGWTNEMDTEDIAYMLF